MLLLYLVNQNDFGSGFSERVVDNGCRDGHKEKHIQENKTNEISIDP